jgi:hypothetical protein
MSKRDKAATKTEPKATNFMPSFNFGVAMSVVLTGGRCRRADWNRPAYVELQTYGGGITAIHMIMRDGRVNAYSPSQCDMLGNDWYKLGEAG